MHTKTTEICFVHTRRKYFRQIDLFESTQQRENQKCSISTNDFCCIYLFIDLFVGKVHLPHSTHIEVKYQPTQINYTLYYVAPVFKFCSLVFIIKLLYIVSYLNSAHKQLSFYETLIRLVSYIQLRKKFIYFPLVLHLLCYLFISSYPFLFIFLTVMSYSDMKLTLLNYYMTYLKFLHIYL